MPVFGVIVATIIGLLFLLPFPAWSELVNVVTLRLGGDVRGRPARPCALRKAETGPAADVPATGG